jgi:NAD(P)-dependent dehydrogenase (short-subunit alcohol dehydrogenase family)
MRMGDETLPRAALVTGAAKRVGRALALALAADGFDVALHCHRSRAEAEDLAREIGALGRRAAVLAADLAREDEVEPLVPAAREALGDRPLGVLVNNASHFRLDRLLTADRASWDAHLEPNLRAPVVLTRAFVRQLPDATPGAVVNVLDQRVLNLTPNYLSYSVSRAGLWAATQVLARELAPRGVRVNAIGPGPTLPAPGMPEERFRELVEALPLRRGPTPEELAEALRFILRMPAMTGQLVTVDGGQQMGWLTPTAPPDVE